MWPACAPVSQAPHVRLCLLFVKFRQCYYTFEDLLMMGVRLVPEIWSAVLYHSGFLVAHVSMTHAWPD